MIRREVIMPVELVQEIAEIVNKEDYPALKGAFLNRDVKPAIFLSK